MAAGRVNHLVRIECLALPSHAIPEIFPERSALARAVFVKEAVKESGIGPRFRGWWPTHQHSEPPLCGCWEQR